VIFDYPRIKESGEKGGGKSGRREGLFLDRPGEPPNAKKEEEKERNQKKEENALVAGGLDRKDMGLKPGRKKGLEKGGERRRSCSFSHERKKTKGGGGGRKESQELGLQLQSENP